MNLSLTEESYSYDRDIIPIKVDKLSDMLKNIIHRLEEVDLQLLSCSG